MERPIANDEINIDPLAGKRILTVEDEGITQLQWVKMLKLAGMEHVGLARNGPQAVSLALQLRPDMILMDINMPGEFNGLEASRQILRQFRTCIIILTAYADCADLATEIGAHGYVVKPLDRNTVLEQMREALAKFEAS